MTPFNQYDITRQQQKDRLRERDEIRLSARMATPRSAQDVKSAGRKRLQLGRTLRLVYSSLVHA